MRGVRRLDMRAAAAGAGPGSRRSRHRGEGMEFAGVRGYVAGDDSRRIDWNVSARHGALHVKEFAEERERGVYVALDVSASHDCGIEKSRRALAREVAASIVLSAARGGDRVGLGLFADSLGEFVPAGRGNRHAAGIVGRIAARGAAGGGTDVARSVAQLHARLGGRCTIFIVSDFESAPFGAALRRLASRHRVVLVAVSDAAASDIPDVGRACIEDAESGEQVIVDTSDARFRAEYARLARETEEAAARGAARLGVRRVVVSPDEPFEAAFNGRAGGRR